MKEIAKILLDIEAVALSPDKPFTWASGILSPIYCDNRLILSYPKERFLVETALAQTIRAEFPQAEMLMGTATAGIPHAALAADQLELPMGFVRAKAKDHGKENAIEGRLLPGQRVVVVEDLVSTGGSSLAVVDALRAAGADVLGLVSIFTYGMERAKLAFQEKQLPMLSLTNYDELLEVALEQGAIEERHLKRLRAFMQNPSDPSWQELQ